MTYTTNTVKVAKSGIIVGYLDQQGAASQQTLSFDNKTFSLDSGIAVAAGNASFAEDLSVSGGVNMGGIAHIEGAATLASTLAVSGAASMDSTLDVTGASHLSSTLLVDGASHVVGALTQDGAASFGSTVAVSGAASMGSTLDVTGASHLGSTLLVDGASHVVGALTQDGAASFGSTMDVTGASHLASTLLVDGVTTLGSTLNVTGASHLASTAQMDGAVSMGSTLTVSGATTMNNGMTVNGTTTMNGAMAVSGAATIGGAMETTGATNLKSTLDVTGASHLKSTLLVDGASHLKSSMLVDGTTELRDVLSVYAPSYLNSTVHAGSDVNIGSNLQVTGTSRLVGEVTAVNAVVCESSINVAGAASVGSTLSVTGAASMSDALSVSGAASVGSTLSVTGAASMSDALSVSGAASIGGALDVTGTSHFVDAITADSSVSITGATSIGSTLNVTGDSYLMSAITVDGAAALNSTLNVTGATAIESTLDVTGAATFQNDVTVNGNFTVVGSQTSISTTSLEVTDNAMLLAKGNTADSLETGMMIQYQLDGTNTPLYAGLKRRPNTGEFVFFKDAAQQILDGGSDPLALQAVPKGVTLRISYVNWNGEATTELRGGIISGNDSTFSHYYIYASTTLNGTNVELVHVQNGGNSGYVAFNGRTLSSTGQKFITYYIIFDKLTDPSSSYNMNLNPILLYDRPISDYLDYGDLAPDSADLFGGYDIYEYTTDPKSAIDLFYNNQAYYYLQPNNQASIDGVVNWDETTHAFTGSYDAGLQALPITAISALEGYTIAVTYTTPIHLTTFMAYAFNLSEPGLWAFNIYGATEPTDTSVKLVHHQVGYMPDSTVTVNVDSTNSYKKFYIVISQLDSGDWTSLNKITFYENDVEKVPTSVTLLQGFGPMLLDVYDADGVFISSDEKDAMLLFTAPDLYWFNISSTLYNAVNFEYDFNAYIGTVDNTLFIDYTPQGAPAAPSSSSGSGSGQTIPDIYATVLADGFTCASDKRLKKDIVNLNDSLSNIDKIRGVYYKWADLEFNPNKVKKGIKVEDRQIGVIAQEIQAVYPELVHDGGNGYLSVDYPKLTAVLIESVKELKALVMTLVAAKQQ